MATAKETVTRSINNALSTILQQRKDIKLLKKMARKIEPIVDVLTMEIDYVSVYVSGDEIQISATVYNLDSFKCERLAKLLDYLNDKVVGDPTTRDWPSSINRDYRFEVPDGIMVNLSAYVKDDSATCRRIVVGTETKVVEKYEIQCD
jgi:hypothetical protein